MKISYETYRLEEGDFLLINPYETHALGDAGSGNGNIAAIIQCGEELYGKKDGILMWQATLYNKDSHLHQQVKTMIREILAADMKTGDGSGRQTDEKPVSYTHLSMALLKREHGPISGRLCS